MSEKNDKTLADCSDPLSYENNWAYVLKQVIRRDPVKEREIASQMLSHAVLELLRRDLALPCGNIYSSVPRQFYKSPASWVSKQGRGYRLVGWPKDVPRGQKSEWPAPVSICVSKLILKGLIRIDSPYSRGDIYGRAKLIVSSKKSRRKRIRKDDSSVSGRECPNSSEKSELVSKPQMKSRHQTLRFGWQTPMSRIQESTHRTSGSALLRDITLNVASMSDEQIEEIANKHGLPTISS